MERVCSAAIVKMVVVIALGAGFPHPAEAYRTTRRRPVSRPLTLDVQPTPEIEAQVAEEVAKARGILDDLNFDNLLASPYLVSAIYYHDGFLSGFSVDRSNADPERRIIGQISKMLSADHKTRFLRLLHETWNRSDPAGPQRLAVPVAYSALGGGRQTHRYAIDLFAREGTTVHAVSRGIVVLADREWDPANLFSTTSRKGGNAVIVFDPDHDRFYRYCHMSTVQVSTGELVTASQIVGSVGHSGLNASQPGHGRHLHFETNEYLEGHVRAIDYRRLRTMLRQWRSFDARDGSGSVQARTRQAGGATCQTCGK
uniref:Peptidase M23B n=1 Tax=Solibacter usitatus (strain Ellin6076) TaxID=234267 RepID=Q01PB4_SOLUE